MKKILAVAALLTVAGVAHAQATMRAAAPARFLLGMGLSGGGDKLASAEYTNGDTANIHAGGLVYFTAGVDYRFAPEFSLQATVNYHVDRANAKNGDMKFERVPVELIAYYQPNPAWRVGGGVRYSSSPTFSGSGIASGMDVDFDSSTGTVIETEYFTSPKFGIKARYVNEKFKSRGLKEIDGSHVGLSFNYYF